MIYIIFLIAAVVLIISYFVVRKILNLRITWNEHKSLVFKINKRTSFLVSENNKIETQLNEIIYHINQLNKKFNHKTKGIEQKLDNIQYELFLEHIEEIAKGAKEKKQISAKTFKEFKQLLHKYKMDSRIKELMNKQ